MAKLKAGYSMHYHSLDLTNIPLDKMVAILADDHFKCISVSENDNTPIRISLIFVPTGPIDNTPAALARVIAWRRTGDKPLTELMLTHLTYAYAALEVD